MLVTLVAAHVAMTTFPTPFRLLALRKLAGAEAVFTVFTHKHPDLAGEEPPYRQAPLTNFLWFLLSTIMSSRYTV